MYGAYYQIVNRMENYTQAVTTCQASGGRLFEPKSQNINQMIANRFVSLNATNNGFWAGINDFNVEGS